MKVSSFGEWEMALLCLWSGGSGDVVVGCSCIVVGDGGGEGHYSTHPLITRRKNNIYTYTERRKTTTNNIPNNTPHHYCAKSCPNGGMVDVTDGGGGPANIPPFIIFITANT